MNGMQPLSTSALVKNIKEAGEDFEFYPSTPEIIACVRRDIDVMIADARIDERPSILDCGAGDGRVLMQLSEGKRYAIEKSSTLIAAMDKDIFIVGTDLFSQSLLDKQVQVTFTNSPYSNYQDWLEKIITETSSKFIYFVAPTRWVDSDRVKAAIESRKAKTAVLGSFDFFEADRKARAVVDVVRVSLCASRYSGMRGGADTDPFELWFNANFKNFAPNKTRTVPVDADSPPPENKIENGLATGSDLVTVLVGLYEVQMDKLMLNYTALNSMDGELLRELGVEFKDIREGLRMKIKGCKNTYWRELFDRLDKVTDRLTKKSREQILGQLMTQTDVDFNAPNIYSILGWVIKQSNEYLDKQLIDVVDRMVEKANIVAYKSNQRTFSDENWRYRCRPNDISHYGLDYRVVFESGGIFQDGYWRRVEHHGLSETAYHFLGDLITIAGNLGFDVKGMERPSDFEWESNKKCVFHYRDHMTGEIKELMACRAFKKGTTHIKFHEGFIMALNVEHGRLRGWLKNPVEAAEELNIDEAVAAKYFHNNLQITASSLKSLGFNQAA